MDGNEDCLTQTVEASVGSLLSSDNIVTVEELPILQEGNALVNTDSVISNGHNVLGVPIIRHGSLLSATSQGLVITNTDGTRTFLLDANQLTVLTHGGDNAATIYDINTPIASAEVIPVIYGEDIQDKGKLPSSHEEPRNNHAGDQINKDEHHFNDPIAPSYDFSDIQPPIRKVKYSCIFSSSL